MAKSKRKLAGVPDKKWLEDKAEELRKRFGVVGMALSVWKDGEQFVHRGFGSLEINKAETVNEQTVFAIASMTKAFAAFIIYKLVELGTISSLDDPVQKYLPWFNLKSPHTSRVITIRMCLTHYTGISRHDYMWYALDMEIEEIARRLEFIEPSWAPFQGGFHYNNIMVSVGALCAEAVTGKKWYELVKMFILEPLGMKRTNFSVKDLKDMENVATPHADYGHGQQPITYHSADGVGAAASMNSNIDALSRWLKMHLADGMFDGMMLIKPELLNDMHVPQVTIKVSNPQRGSLPPLNFFGYSPGWFSESFRDQIISQHGGNMDGMTSLIAMIRDMKLGMVLLTNQDSSHLREALMYTIFDAFINHQAPGAFKSVDFGKAILLKAREDAKADAKQAKEEAKILMSGGTPASLPLSAYVGTYESPVWDKMSVSLVRSKGSDGKESENLWIAMRGDLAGKLTHIAHDTFLVEWVNQREGSSILDFWNRQDKVVLAECRDLDDGRFKRVSDKPEKEPKLTEFKRKARKARRNWYKSAHHQN